MNTFGPSGTRTLKAYNLPEVVPKATLLSTEGTNQFFRDMFEGVEFDAVVSGDMDNYPHASYLYEVEGVHFKIRRALGGNYCAYANLPYEELKHYQEITGWDTWDGWDYGHSGQLYLFSYGYPPDSFMRKGVFVTHEIVLDDMVKTIVSILQDRLSNT